MNQCHFGYTTKLPEKNTAPDKAGEIQHVFLKQFTGEFVAKTSIRSAWLVVGPRSFKVPTSSACWGGATVRLVSACLLNMFRRAEHEIISSSSRARG
jgi:hypothetical protein